MATFYPQLFSNESLSHQWQRYLQYKPIINNVEDIIQNQTTEYTNTLEKASQEQIQAMQASTKAVCGTINSGFEIVSEHLNDLSYGLDEISGEINGMSSILSWGFSCLIEKQRITNLLLSNISVLLGIPDFQKERQDYIEKGLKFLKNAFFDNDLYDNSLKYLLKAEDKEPEDYFVLYRIGLIYLFSPKHIELSKAEAYFKKAAKYAVVEANSGASLSKNHLTSDLSKDLLSQMPTVESIKIQAAESFLLAGRSCYLQGKFGESAELAGKAFSLVPQMVEAGFTQAQALTADNKVQQSVEVLASVIERDRFYSIKTARHLDLSSRIEIQNLLEKLRQEAFKNASKFLSECKGSLIDESIVQNEIEKIEKLIKHGSFLHCKKAIDLLTKNNERTFSDIFQSNKKSSYKPNRNLSELPSTLLEISEKVKYPDSYLSEINNLFSFLSENTQWNFPQISKLAGVTNFSSGYEPKKLTSALFNFVKKEKDYFERLHSAKAKIRKMVEEIYNDDINRRKADEMAHSKMLIEVQKVKDKKSIGYAFEYAMGWGGTGAAIGAIVIGFAGCRSCLNNYTDNDMITDFNLFNGLLYGAVGGFILGGLIGVVAGWSKGQE